ncbi:MAG: sigma 54-interacting transcriptional regulator [Melioribacteraceae bacterium]|nr:MAG: sigma 54-interacting transcriptional regulator [Melioribacteraceae bacterium]
MNKNSLQIDSLAADGVIAINKEQKVIVFDDAACRITGFGSNEVISKDISFLFPKENEREVYIISSLSTGEFFSNISLTITCTDNKELLITASITPLIQPNQGIIGLIMVFRDTNETLSLQKALAAKKDEVIQEKNKLEIIFNSLLEGTFTVNTEWEITAFNKAAEQITGFTEKEAINKKYWEILLSEDSKQDAQLKSFIAEHYSNLLRETTIIRRNGTRVPVRINSASLLNTAGEKIGRVVTFEDISVVKNLTDHITERYHFKNIIGRSKSMLKVYNLMQNVVNTDSTVLITGKSGTGKEIIARSIHINSERKSTPFVAVNCSAFAETLLESELFGHEKGAFTGAIRTKPGRFELAGEGTLFIDEIGDIPLSIQVKLLRVLENRQFERVGGTETIELKARIISATHRNLEKEIREGRFREDLFYRINVINIHLPPLKERRDDIPSLINHFIEKFNKKFKKDIHYISPNALKLVSNYEWPGNIRELENVIEHAFVVSNSEAIHTGHLPERFQNTSGELDHTDERELVEKPLDNAEKELIESMLKKFNGNRIKTAEALGINKTTLWRKMKKFNLK